MLHVPVDVLHHDDGVVDDEADGDHHGKQRQRVDGEPEQEDQEEAAGQRDGNGQQRYQRGAPRPQEQENHRQHQHECLGDGDVDRVDRRLHIDRLVPGDLAGNAFGKRRQQVGQDGVDVVGHGHLGFSLNSHLRRLLGLKVFPRVRCEAVGVVGDTHILTDVMAKFTQHACRNKLGCVRAINAILG